MVQAWIGLERLNVPKFALLLGAWSAAVGIAANPLSVVTANMQQSKQQGGTSKTWSTVRRIMKDRGLLAFYRGVSGSLIGHAPVEVFYFSVLETSRAFFLTSPLVADVVQRVHGEVCLD